MAKYKHTLPGWVKSAVRSYVRGYDDLRMWYEHQRQNIICSSGGESIGHSYDIDRPVERRADRLADLDKQPNSRRLAAIDQALFCVGNDIGDYNLRVRLKEAMMLNCAYGRDYPFEIMNLSGIDRNDFYRQVNTFIYNIAVYEGLVMDER